MPKFVLSDVRGRDKEIFPAMYDNTPFELTPTVFIPEAVKSVGLDKNYPKANSNVLKMRSEFCIKCVEKFVLYPV